MAPPSRVSRPQRILILGGSGTGKTSLARTMAEELGFPVYHLDDIARSGGGTGPPRSPSDRRAAVREILGRPRWVAEGIHLGWTDDLLAEADLIVWLDHVSWRHASWRNLKRFTAGAIEEFRRQKGLRKFTRFRDYARHAGDLIRSIPEIRSYHKARAPSTSGDDPSRSETGRILAEHRHKVIHCRTPAQLEDLKRSLRL